MPPLLIIGQAPSASSDPAEPVERSVRRLAALAEMPAERLLAAVDRRNLLDRYPGPRTFSDGRRARGDRFPAAEAKRAAAGIDLTGRRALLLGRAVGDAFRLPRRMPYFTWVERNGGLVALVPHPSGVNRYYNDRLMAWRVGLFVRTAVLDYASAP